MTVALALETSTDACSIALGVDETVLEDHRIEPRAHDRLVLDMIDGLLQRADVARDALELVAFGHGPGSFTGLRIAAGVAQGLGWALERPVIGVSTLHVIAAVAARELEPASLLVALDARMDEIYWNRFETIDGRVAPSGADRVDPPAAIARMLAETAAEGRRWIGVGNAWRLPAMADVGARLARTVPDVLPRAGQVLALGLEGHAAGRSSSAQSAAPVYLRGDSRWRRSGSVSGR